MSRQTITLSKHECREALRALAPPKSTAALEAHRALIDAFVESRTETVAAELSDAARQTLAAALATRESWLRGECEAGLAAGEQTVATTYGKLLRWAASARARIEAEPPDDRATPSGDRQAPAAPGPPVPRRRDHARPRLPGPNAIALAAGGD